jgi:hypothetical protein
MKATSEKVGSAFALSGRRILTNAHVRAPDLTFETGARLEDPTAALCVCVCVCRWWPTTPTSQ